MKRIISILLTITMLISAASVMSVNASEYDELYQLPFTDLNYDAWYMEGIDFCYGMEFVNGMSATKFEPNGTLTRAQFVQILSQLDYVELADYEGMDSGFDDVKPDHWFNEAVVWAVEMGYVKGLSETRFGPNEPITREQLARLLYLYGTSDPTIDENAMSVRDDLAGYADAGKVSDWALEGMQWAVAAGIISGMNETTLAPRATATRAQVCRMIMSYWEFMLYGVKDTSGAFAAMAEYIMENGVLDNGMFGEYNIFTETEGELLVAGYIESEEALLFGYFTEPYEFEFEGETTTMYREITVLTMNGLEEMYGIVYIYGDIMNLDTHSVLYDGMLTRSGFTEIAWECLGYEEADYRPRAEAAVGKVTALLEETLSHTEYTMDDIFKADLSADRSGAFKVIADYTVANATSNIYGTYSYEIIKDNRFYTLEYDLTMQTISIYYGAYEELQFGGDEKTTYAYIYFDGLASEYEYCFDYWFNEEEMEYYCLEGLLGNGSFAVLVEDFNPDAPADLEYAKALEAESRAAIIEFIDLILGENSLTREDFFIAE